MRCAIFSCCHLHRTNRLRREKFASEKNIHNFLFRATLFVLSVCAPTSNFYFHGASVIAKNGTRDCYFYGKTMKKKGGGGVREKNKEV